MIFRQRTEHETEVQVHVNDDAPYVETILAGGLGVEDEIYLSLTPAEARSFADSILTASQLVEDRIPHYNS